MPIHENLEIDTGTMLWLMRNPVRSRTIEYADNRISLYAAQYGKSTKVLKLLLDNEALTSLRSTEGKTAFDYACDNKNLAHNEIYWQLNKK